MKIGKIKAEIISRMRVIHGELLAYGWHSTSRSRMRIAFREYRSDHGFTK